MRRRDEGGDIGASSFSSFILNSWATMMERAVAGFLLATLIAIVGRRAGALDRGGALAAVIVGTSSTAAGWTWAVLLLVFFVTSTLLSRWGDASSDGAVRAGVVEKGGSRDAFQVMANGGLFALSGLLALATGVSEWHFVGLGALSASMADTWGTEVGTALGGVPRSVLGGARVPPGTSGAVTVAGTLATIAGGATFALAVLLLGGPGRMSWSTFVGGVAGALSDTLLGATVQERRWCVFCGEGTERLVHRCGTPTVHRGGIAGMRNDAVNLTSCAIGGVVTLLLAGGF